MKVQLCKGWLEPLIVRVAQDRRRVVCPVIDIISDETFAYVRSFELHWGAFNWQLHFRWYTMGADQLKIRKQDITQPFRYIFEYLCFPFTFFVSLTMFVQE